MNGIVRFGCGWMDRGGGWGIGVDCLSFIIIIRDFYAFYCLIH